MAELAEQPFPPGEYPVVVVGTGAGGLQVSYALSRLGVRHALLSADAEPAGMFRRFPFFQRLITWTKPYAPAERDTREFEWFDWNSPIGEEPTHRGLVAEFMDGTSYFPSRAEMQAGIEAFADRAGIRARYGCTWEGTRREGDTFVVQTSDGEYRTQVFVPAVGMTAPWKPDNIPGMDDVPHYVDLEEPKHYQDKTVFVIGKRNSGFEVADGLLPWARQIYLGSPRPARISILTHSTAAARARYMQPYEDHVLGGGGVFVLDVAIERVERTGDGFRIHARGTTTPGEFTFDVDHAIAATGFTTPMRDLPEIGVSTFYQDRLPSQTAFWESAAVRGIFFAGSTSQGSIGLKKYGRPGGGAAVHGFRYSAQVMARHIAEDHLGMELPRRTVPADEAVAYLAREAAHAPELYHQQSYLARVLTFDPGRGIVDEGILPLAHFVDASGPDAVAVAIETDDTGDIHPAAYLRRGGRVEERILPGHPLLDFETAEHRAELRGLLEGYV
ncbi:MAG TPA: NAD(P)-binding domain-containing protein [Actinomycetota bacterium]|nr:NAD(P)-binding domain-containing protein [Actinomycetota bacterium]